MSHSSPPYSGPTVQHVRVTFPWGEYASCWTNAAPQTSITTMLFPRDSAHLLMQLILRGFRVEDVGFLIEISCEHHVVIDDGFIEDLVRWLRKNDIVPGERTHDPIAISKPHIPDDDATNVPEQVEETLSGVLGHLARMFVACRELMADALEIETDTSSKERNGKYFSARASAQTAALISHLSDELSSEGSTLDMGERVEAVLKERPLLTQGLIVFIARTLLDTALSGEKARLILRGFEMLYSFVKSSGSLKDIAYYAREARMMLTGDGRGRVSPLQALCTHFLKWILSSESKEGNADFGKQAIIELGSDVDQLLINFDVNNKLANKLFTAVASAWKRLYEYINSLPTWGKVATLVGIALLSLPLVTSVVPAAAALSLGATCLISTAPAYRAAT